MRVFLAGPGTQRSFLGHLIREKLPSMGYESYDWTSGPGWDNPQAFVPLEVARKDIEEIRRSDFVVRFVDGEHLSDGAAFESGYCIASGIPLVTWLCPSLQGKPPHNYIYSHLTFEDGNHQVANSLEDALRLGAAASQFRHSDDSKEEPAYSVWSIEDSSDGKTWVVARSEAEAYWLFTHGDDDSLEEYLPGDVEIEKADPSTLITMERESCDGGSITQTAEEWCRVLEPGVFCSTWWVL